MYTYKRVALIGVDGAGNFFRQSETPAIDRIFRDGSVAYDVYTSTPSISAECWGSMLHGVTPDLHRLTNSIVSSTPYDTESIFPSVFRIIRENDPDCELASFCNWNPINYGIIENNLNVTEGTGNDESVTDQICAYLADHDPKFLFVQFDQVDGAGHGHGYGTPAHLNQISVTDGYIERIWEAYEKRGFLDDTLFIVTADHGGYGRSHGGKTEEEMRVMFALCGKTVKKGGAAVDMQIRDSASIVLYALGLKQPDTWTSIVPSGVFEGVEAAERPEFHIEYQYGYRTHETIPTPEKNAADLLGSDRIIAYFPFDDSTDDVSGKRDVSASGKFYYLDGYYGKGLRMDDACISVKDYEPGTGSFSLAFWLKTGGSTGDPCICSNKDWKSGKNPGFVVALTPGSIRFNFGDGTNRMDAGCNLPLDYKDGWIYTAVSVDRTAGTVGFSMDFGKFRTFPIPEALKDVSMNAFPGINLGRDGTGSYDGLPAVLDDFLIVDGILTDDDIAALKGYYNA